MNSPPLAFLADESCDFSVVRSLRANGFDVFAVSEVMSRSVDRDLIAQAYRENRVLLTEDKDFGRLVYVSHVHSPGVILIRFPGNLRASLAETVVRFVQDHSEEIRGAFVVVQPGHVRTSRTPPLPPRPM